MHRRVHGVWLRVVLGLLTVGAGLVPGAAKASLIAYDGFNYPAGFFLNGQGLATDGWSGAYGGDVSARSATIGGGSLPYGGLAAVGNAAQTATSLDGLTNNTRSLASSLGADGTTAYLSFLIDPNEAVNSGGHGSYAGFSIGSLFVGKLTTGFYGIETLGGSGQVSSPQAPFQNVTALLVVRITFQSGNDKIELFVNPPVGQPLPATADATKTDLDLGTTSDTSLIADHGVEVDEFRIGTTLADVTPAPVAQPSVLLFQNQATNGLARWFMSGTAVVGSQLIPPTPDMGWKVMGTGDFHPITAEGPHQDLVFQNQTTGAIVIWFLKDQYFVGGVQVSTTPDTGFIVSAVTDMDGDGKPDLILQNHTTGQMVVWFMNGTLVDSTFNLTSTDPNYNLVGAGDFDFNGTNDLLFQNQVTGEIVVWYYNRTVLRGSALLGNVPAAGWKVVAVGDYNGDGRPDLVFQNTTTNKVAFWYLKDFVFIGGDVIDPTPLADYKIIGPH